MASVPDPSGPQAYPTRCKEVRRVEFPGRAVEPGISAPSQVTQRSRNDMRSRRLQHEEDKIGACVDSLVLGGVEARVYFYSIWHSSGFDCT